MRLSLALIVAPVLGAQVSPVQKVIQLIDELKTKVSKNLAAEKASMEEYTSFCDDEASEKGYAIKTAGKAIDGYKAVIEDTTGQIQGFSSVVESSASEGASKGAELASATEVRKNENTDFKAAEKELVEAVDTLARAVVIIKREMSFVQGTGKNANSAIAKKLGAMEGALSTIIEASWLDGSSRKQLKSFMATSAEADDELSLKQPQAITKAYESKSGGIVETLEDMKDKAETSLNSLRRDETKARHAFELIKQSLNDAITILNKEIAEATSSKSGAEEKLAKAQGDLSTTEAAKAADEAYLAKLNAECSAKASEWDERQKSAEAEMAALAKGHEILSAKFGFAQLSVKTTKVAGKDINSLAASLDGSSRDRVLTLLRKLGRNYNSFAMMQIANAATSDPFVKIRGLIENMIEKLLKQSQEEATHESFCKEETAKSAKARDEKQASADKYAARIDEAKAGIAELKGEVSELAAEITDIDKSNAEATKLRQAEKAEFNTASTDYKESAEAVTQALVVLKDFYRGGAFVQTAVAQPEFDSTRGDAGHSIIEILEVSQADFTRLLAEAETSESEAVNAYKALMQENKVAKATKQTSVKAKNSEIKSLEVALTHHNEDLDTVSKELDAVMDYLEKLKPQCESRAMTYEERKAKREAEIAGLKEALSILESDEGAAAFIQKKVGFMSKN
jgi:chromosome segregation ATPase